MDTSLPAPATSDKEPASRQLQPYPEVWGGVEATVNRVGDRYFDQIRRSGHIDRIEDLDLFASLGIKAIRYPVLWEHVAPDGLDTADWSWPDERLHRMRELGIRPIVGLLHHGSGPPDTCLTDPAFPERLAAYALAVASRYPWVTDYTPVNEPLTTARFSALYGHWYPHQRDDLSFATALLNECKATVLSLEAIRAVQPKARLIQTEDIGETHSTPYLANQAAFENERRWLTFDLLTGTLSDRHPMLGWLTAIGVPPDELRWFQEHRCPPDVLAVNYYLTSERFLDEDHEKYDGEVTGSNGRDTYVDVAALHILPDGIGRFRSVLKQAWDRYRRPLCIGEAHLGGQVEEQMRWLNAAWHDVLDLRAEGVDVRAVTVWALLGSHDWPSLAIRDDGQYEPGPFDIRAPAPRPTALARMVRSLASTGEYSHPVLDAPGWWGRDDRFVFGHVQRDAVTPEDQIAARPGDGSENLLIVTGESPLGGLLADACRRRFIPFEIVDMQNTGQLREMSGEAIPWSILFAVTPPLPGTGEAAFWRDAVVDIAAWSAAREVPLAWFSGPSVFDGRAPEPYTESNPVRPDTVAGEILAAAERDTMRLNPRTLVIRLGELFGNGINPIVYRASGDDVVVSPAYAPDVADAAIDLLLDGERGVWHLANGECVTGAAFRIAVMQALGIDPFEQPSIGQNPRMRALASERGWLMPTWHDALARYVEHHREHATSSFTAGTLPR